VSTHAITFSVEDGNDVAIVTLSGHAAPADIHALLMELEGLAQRRLTMRLLVDESDLSAGLMGFKDMHDIASDWRGATALRSRKIAIVASNPFVRGLNQMFRVFANIENKDSMNAFSKRADALAWLVKAPAG
jgi:hypothetical protein